MKVKYIFLIMLLLRPTARRCKGSIAFGGSRFNLMNLAASSVLFLS